MENKKHYIVVRKGPSVANICIHFIDIFSGFKWFYADRFSKKIMNSEKNCVYLISELIKSKAWFKPIAYVPRVKCLISQV